MQAVLLLLDIFKGGVPSLPVSPKDSNADNLRAHILKRLLRLCTIPEPGLAQVAKTALLRAMEHCDVPSGGVCCTPRRSQPLQTVAGE